MMNKNCALCNNELISIDVMLGENKLSDGGILCHNCLERINNINEDAVNDLGNYLGNYSLLQIQEIIKYNVVSKKTEEVSIFNDENNPEQDKDRTKDIKNQIKELGIDLSFTMRGELEELQYVLDEDEKIISAAEATEGYNNGLLLVTQKNLIFVTKSLFCNAKTSKISNTEIKSVAYFPNPEFSKINFDLNEKQDVFYNFDKTCIPNGEKFFKTIKEVYNKSAIKPVSRLIVTVKKESPNQIMDQLEKLGALHENGILTNEEFTTQKKKLLEKL